MKKYYLRQFTTAILLWAYSFQILAGMVIPVNIAPEQPVNTEYSASGVPTSSDSKMGTAEVLNALALDSKRWGLQGPLTFGANYDTLLGMIYDAQYTNKITDKSAFSVIGEYGANQSRANGTLGFQLYPEGLIKFTAEYLSQNLPFEFNSGDINQEVTQNAYGFDFQHNVSHQALKSLNLGGYYAKAPNVSLSTVNYFDEYGIEYINQRNLAGATSQGLDFGGSLILTPMTSLDATLNYDDIVYDTDLTGDTHNNDSGIGGTLQINQLIGERMLFSANTEFRPIYNSYGLELSYAPAFAKIIGLEVGLFAERLISSNETPNSNIYGLHFTFLGDASGKAPNYGLNAAQGNMDVLDWVKNPAVYMERVLIMAEQITTIANPLEINLMSPTSGPFEGGNTLIIHGVGFVPSTQVLFNGTPGVVTFISSTELSVIVPSAIQANAVSVASTTITTPVNVVVTNPNGDSFTFDIQYTYTTGPTLESLTPTTGPTLGGTEVTLTGTNFTETTSVTFADIAANSFTVVNDTTVTAVAPPNLEGVADVVLTTTDGNSTLSNAFTYTASDNSPTITGISPSAGVTTGATSVVITGSNFVGASAVNFGSTSATSFTIDTPQQITAVSPAGSGTVDITVITPIGTSATSSADQFTYGDAPTVTGVSPNSGSTAGGSGAGGFVVITGTGFSGATAVHFGTTLLTSSYFTINSATRITVSSFPAGSAGTVDVTVTTSLGTSATSTADQFTYITAPTVTSVSPNSGSTAGGTVVTIAGTGFTSDSTVTFSGVAATSVSYDSATGVLTATSPSSNYPGVAYIIVTTSGISSDFSSAAQFSYLPTVTGVSPNNGSTSGGTLVTITGTGFVNGVTVNFGASSASSVTYVNSTTLRAYSPVSSTGSAQTVDITVTISGVTSATSTADQFTYTSAPVIRSMTPTFGLDTGGTVVTIGGENLSTTSGVNFGANPATSVSYDGSTGTVTATSPAGSGMVDVTVIGEGGTSAITTVDQFTYVSSSTPTVSSISPNTGTVAGGTTVTINGTNFSDTSTVNFGVTAATSVTYVNSTTLTAYSPVSSSGAQTVDITVTTSGLTSPISSTDQFTYFIPPGTVSSVIGSPITLTGTNLNWLGASTSLYQIVQFNSSTPSEGSSFNFHVTPTSVSSTSMSNSGSYFGGAYAAACSSSATTYSTSLCTNAVAIQ